MNILIAFDKFKDAIPAEEACNLAEEAIRRTGGPASFRRIPLSDGGEGFTRIFTGAVAGEFVECRVSGPRSAPVDATYGVIDLVKLSDQARTLLSLPASGRLAVIEMAQAAGLEQLSKLERNPWETSTHGVGEMILDAVERQSVDAILLGIGGSATNDGGTGALQALGMILYGHDHQPLEKVTPSSWSKVASLGGTLRVSGRIPPVRIACDVRNPLLGDQGATRAFGPQKGLAEEQIPLFERQMEKMARRLLGCFGHSWDSFDDRLAEPGSGAAGGIGFGLRTALPDVLLIPGFELFNAWFGLRESIAWADWIISGEGAVDNGTLQGKGPGRLIGEVGGSKPFTLLAGSIDADTERALRERYPRLTCIRLSPPEWPLEKALAATGCQLQVKLMEIAKQS